MNQRLVWNFEFAPKISSFPKEFLKVQAFEELKWEQRFFWDPTHPIVLNALDECLLDLANYHQKHRDDYYYLLPDTNYNIKRRRDTLFYKPLLKQSKLALAFGSKISIDPSNQDLKIQEMVQEIDQKGISIYVKKEAFIYKFSTKPTIKLELARLEVQNKIYFSTCIEGKSQKLVEGIGELLLDKHSSCDYVTFLKNIVPL
jgi:hypothetical protein